MTVAFWICLSLFLFCILLGIIFTGLGFGLSSETCGMIAFAAFVAVGILGFMVTIIGIFALIAGVMI